MIEIDVCQDMLRCLRVTGVVVGRLQAVHRAALECVIPTAFATVDSTWYNVIASIVTTVEVSQIVHGITLSSSIRVYRDEIVHVVCLCLVSNLKQWTVVLLIIWQILIVLIGIIWIFAIHFLVWPRTTLCV